MFYTDQTPPKNFFYQNGLKWPKMHFGSIFFFLENGFFQTPPPPKTGKFQIFFFFFEAFPYHKGYKSYFFLSLLLYRRNKKCDKFSQATERSDSWSAAQSYYFKVRAKKMLKIKTKTNL